jgi:hypothetical protein
MVITAPYCNALDPTFGTPGDQQVINAIDHAKAMNGRIVLLPAGQCHLSQGVTKGG